MRVEPPLAIVISNVEAPPAPGEGRQLVPRRTGPPATDATIGKDTAGKTKAPDKAARALAEVTGGLDTRRASPREMTDLSLDLYAAGILSYDDYAVLAFQPELHPDYDRTIGALTGEAARPEGRRDFVHEWDERLQFDLRHRAGNSSAVRQTERILQVLKQLAEPTRIDA